MAVDGIGSIFSAPKNAFKAGEALIGGIKVVGASGAVIDMTKISGIALEGVGSAALSIAGALEAGAGIYNMSVGSTSRNDHSDGADKKIDNVEGESTSKLLVDEGQQFTNGRKNKLKPDVRYKTGEFDYYYETDSLGRVEKFETDNLQLTERTERLNHNKNTPGKIKGQDDAGHLAGDRFGGSPKKDNLVSQLSNVNKSQYKKLENKWANAIDEGKTVKVNVEVKYDGDNLRPSEFNVKYEIDGKSYKQNISN